MTNSKFGVQDCTISFVDMYDKVKASFAIEDFEHKELNTQ